MYWSLIQRLRDRAETAGLRFGDVERHAFHKKALGVAKSSKDFTNDDIDEIKRTALGILEPGNLEAQQRGPEQRLLRNVEARAECLGLIERLGIGQGYDADKADFLRKAYLDGIVKNITRGEHVDFQTLKDRPANHILNTLRNRLASHQAKQEAQGVPF
jgi:hypothetical protein